MPAQPPLLIVFAGPACSGKSTLAARLAAERGIPHLEMDRVRAQILPDAGHTRADRQAAYRAMHFTAKQLLRYGVSVILDAPYGHAEDWQDVQKLGPRRLIECRVCPEEAVRRFSKRSPDEIRKDLTPERVEELARTHPYRKTGLLLDTDRESQESCLQLIRNFL